MQTSLPRILVPLLLLVLIMTAVAVSAFAGVRPLYAGVPPRVSAPWIVAGLKTIEPRPATQLSLTYPEAAVEAADGSIYIANALGFTVERVKDDVAETVLTGSTEDKHPSIFLDLRRAGEEIFALDGANARVWRLDEVASELVFQPPAAPNYQHADGRQWATDYMLSSLDVDSNGRFLFTASRVVWQGGAQQYGVENNGLYIGGEGIWEEVPGSRSLSARLGNFRDAVWAEDGTIVTLAGEHLAKLGIDGSEIASVSIDNAVFGGGIVPTEGGWFVGAHTNLLFVSEDFAAVQDIEVNFPTANIGHLSWTAAGDLLVTDTDRQSVYVLKPESGEASAQFGNSGGMSFKIVALEAADDRLLMLDNSTPRIVSYDPENGGVYPVAGDGVQGYDSPGEAAEFSFQYPSGLIGLNDGSVLATDANYRIARVKDGRVDIIAGDIHSGLPFDGQPLAEARFGSLRGMALDREGRLLVVDQTHHSVWRFEIDETVTKVMGTGQPGQWADGGLAVEQPLNHPTGIMVRQDGTILLADSYNHVVVGIDRDGKVFPFAGAMKGTTYQGYGDYSGDGGLATAAQLNTPRQVAEDENGNAYIVDEFNSAIRKVTPEGIISTFAGGHFGFTESGTHMNMPQAGAVLGDFLYVADTGNSIVRAFPLDSAGGSAP